MELQQGDDSDWEFDEDEQDEIFTKATQHVQRTHDKIMPNDLLQLYGLFKQATVGKCNTSKPGLFNMQARAKWTAWEELGSMASLKAKELYVEKLKEIDPQWYDQVQKGKNESGGGGGTGWVVHSIEMPPDNTQFEKADSEKTIFDFVKDRNFCKVEEMINKDALQEIDETGLGLIHWATDANDVQILSLLLSSGCPVDLRDDQKQTALHYATSCGYSECIPLLLQYGADKMAKDIDGNTCVDVADPSVRSLLD
uniref:Acyl-CoA-binding domain-containing protein 6 n=1 Tax=Haematobia irritans TaxID=7368 RepID=A0A1L8EDM0_HAEIR